MAGSFAGSEFVSADSDVAALSAVVDASAGGARVYTAAASHSLPPVGQTLAEAADLGLPIVMTVVSPTDGTANARGGGHSHVMALRDSGWIQLHAETRQDALDLHILAFRLAAELSAPVMVCLDSPLLAHTRAAADVPAQEQVDAFLRGVRPGRTLDVAPEQGQGDLAEVRFVTHARQVRAVGLIAGAGAEFREVFGRDGAALVRAHRLDGARTVAVSLSSALGPVREAVDQLRAAGRRIGAVGVTSYRPFPLRALRRAAGGARQLAVVDRALAPGVGGVLASDVQAALRQDSVPLSTVIAGLGTRPLAAAPLREALDDAHVGALEPVTFLGLDPDRVERGLRPAPGEPRQAPGSRSLLRDARISPART